MRRLLFPMILGLGGAAVLVSLGLWQLQRHDWKQGVLAAMEARIGAAPVALPAVPAAQRDQYLAVEVTGRYSGEGLAVLVSRRQVGPGVRRVDVLEADGGRRILVDRGFVPEAQRAQSGPAAGAARVQGNLLWPDEVDGFTPVPDLGRGLWFARDLPAMAAHLGAEPVLVVLRASDPADPEVEPMPVDTSAIPDNHLGYAVQWFGLAAVWLGMTAFWLWRNRRRPV